jgi:uncharacterized RDD family membrane protein YckC
MAPSQRAVTSLAGGKVADLIYAGLQLRIVAFILDVMVLISFGMLFAAAAGSYLVVDSRLNDGNLSDRAPFVAVAIALAYLLAFVPLYFILLWRWWGKTVGMMAVHIKVISQDGGRVPVGRCALRLFGYAASVLPLFAGLAIALFDRERRTLHDHLAGTVVVELP